MQTLTSNEDYNRFLESKSRTVILYGASWCEGCMKLKPLYERIADKYKDKIGMAYCDVEANHLPIERVPMFVSHYRTDEKDSILGADNERMKLFIKKAIEKKYNDRN